MLFLSLSLSLLPPQHTVTTQVHLDVFHLDDITAIKD